MRIRRRSFFILKEMWDQLFLVTVTVTVVVVVELFSFVPMEVVNFEMFTDLRRREKKNRREEKRVKESE
jgi:hypothetical protein